MWQPEVIFPEKASFGKGSNEFRSFSLCPYWDSCLVLKRPRESVLGFVREPHARLGVGHPLCPETVSLTGNFWLFAASSPTCTTIIVAPGELLRLQVPHQ
jgi:hypothetical protein